MSITLCIPTLNQYELLYNCVNSALSGAVVPGKVSIIDNGANMPKSVYVRLKTICALYHTELFIYTSYVNLGVARSWNWFIGTEAHPMLIVNDDLEFSEYDLANFESAYLNSNAQFFYPDNVDHLNMFSCYLPTQALINKVGMFDENFYPAYFEDNDFAYRMELAGITVEAVPTNIRHIGSATVKSFDGERMVKHHEQFRMNKDYYVNKWGGLPHREIYGTPFNEEILHNKPIGAQHSR